MKRKIKLVVLLCICGAMSLQDLSAQLNPWPALKKEMHPWTRWWWMGSAVDEKNLDRVIGLYGKAGFGGVEITPIYGAKNMKAGI